MSRVRSPAVFLDRDGTLIVDTHYPTDPDAVELIPGVPEALRILRSLGYRLVVVTNQSGLARGKITPEQYRAVAARVDRELERAGASVDATHYCPCHPEYSGPCPCRKPATGMHREAARELGLDLARSWYVGDKSSDVLPVLETGGRGLLVRTGYGAETEASGTLPDGVEVVDDLLDAARAIKAHDEARGPLRSR